MKITADRMRVFPDHFFAGLNTKIREMQAQGQDVIRLDIGSPDLPPDPHIIESLKKGRAQANLLLGFYYQSIGKKDEAAQFFISARKIIPGEIIKDINDIKLRIF